MAAAAKTDARGKKTGTRGGGKKRGRLTASELEGKDALAQADDGLSERERAELEQSLVAQSSPDDEPVLDEDDDEPIETIDATSSSVAAPAEDLPQAPPRRGMESSIRAPVAPPIVRSDHAVVYGPDRTRHMSEMGPVCMTNWIGRVNGYRISVRMGAPLSTIPTAVRQALAKARIRFGHAAPPAGGGGRALPAEPPRARRGRGARKTDDNPRRRPFRSVQGLHSRP